MGTLNVIRQTLFLVHLSDLNRVEMSKPLPQITFFLCLLICRWKHLTLKKKKKKKLKGLFYSCLLHQAGVPSFATWEEKSLFFFSLFIHFYSTNEKRRARPHHVFIHSFPTDLPFIVLTVVRVGKCLPKCFFALGALSVCFFFAFFFS